MHTTPSVFPASYLESYGEWPAEKMPVEVLALTLTFFSAKEAARIAAVNKKFSLASRLSFPLRSVRLAAEFGMTPDEFTTSFDIDYSTYCTGASNEFFLNNMLIIVRLHLQPIRFSTHDSLSKLRGFRYTGNSPNVWNVTGVSRNALPRQIMALCLSHGIMWRESYQK